jgi:hypothetical protein
MVLGGTLAEIKDSEAVISSLRRGLTRAEIPSELGVADSVELNQQ